MPIDRPTFSESWYRVAQLRPRLRSTVQMYRQHFRGQSWHVVQDPASNQFSRLSDSAYYFIALLDGQRTIAQVWQICNEQLGDNAPTQGEAIQLLGQLYTSNLLQAELPPDAQGLFERFRKRKAREIQGFLMNLLFIRIPLLDPDHFLNRWVSVFGKIFTWYGFVVWAILVGTGVYFLIGRGGDLVNRASGVLSPDNLPLLYLSFWVVKIFHEFAHAFSCKKFGRQDGSGGEIHVMGIMFLVLIPLPYVDATSAWAFRRKWHRVIVGAAGILVELAIAGIAAVVWANTSQGTVTHAIAYNVMFIASVSTLLFNGNPLLRFDGYYIMSDLLEIPNLAHRSRQFIYYLVRRYAWAVRNPLNPAHTTGEKAWFVFYGIASTVYRVFICIRILLFVADKLFMVGAIMAITAGVTWVVVPLGKFAHYLATSGELARVRKRAVGSMLAILVTVFVATGLVPRPDRHRVEGVVEPVRFAFVHAQTDEFVLDSLKPSGTKVAAGDALLTGENPWLSARLDELLAQRNHLQARWRLAQTLDVAAAQAISEQLDALQQQIVQTQERIEALTLRAPLAGTWVSPNIEQTPGAYLRRGDRVGLVASLDDVLIRAVAPQEVAAILIAEGTKKIEIRVKGRPDIQLTGTDVMILPVGQDQLPSAALGYAAGGTVRTAPDDQRGTKAAERFFELRITPAISSHRLLPGQRVIIRLQCSDKPLLAQWSRSILQLVQRRFHI